IHHPKPVLPHFPPLPNTQSQLEKIILTTSTLNHLHRKHSTPPNRFSPSPCYVLSGSHTGYPALRAFSFSKEHQMSKRTLRRAAERQSRKAERTLHLTA